MSRDEGRSPPGPNGLRALWSTLVGRDLLRVLSRMTDRYGDLVRIDSVAGRKAFFVLRSADHVEHVFVQRHDNYTKSFDYRLLAVVTGKGLLTNEGEPWAQQRRSIQPMFSARHLSSFAEQMTAAAGGTLDRWERQADGARLDVASEMSALTLDVVGRALFGADLVDAAERIGPAVTLLLRVAIFFGRVPFMWLVPDRYITGGPRWIFRLPVRRLRRIGDAMRTLDDVADAMIDRRLAQPATDDGDLLGLLLAARDPETGEGMSRRQVRDELMTFLLAGHETTANGLAWMWYLLSLYPDARAQLFDEVDSVLGGRVPTAEDAEKLVWTRAVFEESMRLYPPAWIIERDAIGPDEIDGYPIPAGSTLIVSPYLIHRNPAYWPNPEGFEPRRFLPGGAAGRPRGAYLPFGAGRRICVGAGFATLEATLLAAMITQRYRLDLVPGARVVPEPTATLRPRDGIPMTLHRRSGSG
jgi:cytochrome P450